MIATPSPTEPVEKSHRPHPWCDWDRMRAAIPPEILKFLARLIAHEILNGVIDWRRMRLHRNPVFRSKHIKIERRHMDVMDADEA